MSLSVKLKLFMSMLMIPSILMIVFLLYTTLQYTNRYNEIIENITVASEFSVDFEQVINSEVYQYIIGGSKQREEYNTEENIAKANETLQKLKKTTTAPESIRTLKWIEHYLNKLQLSIDEIYAGTTYETNINRYYNNVDVLTELMTKQIYEYIYYEAREVNSLRALINSEITQATQIIGFSIIGLVLIFWFVSVMISNSIAKPMKELCNNTQKVAQGDFTIRPINSGSDEIKMLSNSFDRMVEKIGTLIQDVKEEQQNLRLTELKLLQAQINPHFLYNTFDTIIWLAEDNKNADVVRLITSLSNFFRITLSKGKDHITIAEEMSHVISYLEIQQVRYHDILEYEIDISPEIYNYQILKLSLQPLVENALYHGIKNKRGIGRIKISGYKEGGNLFFKVYDNGIGMTDETLNKLRDSLLGGDDTKSFGLKNVQQRIKLNYGHEYGLSIESIYMTGTTAIIIIPATYT